MLKHGQTLLAHQAAISLCDEIYFATLGTEGEPNREAHISKAKEHAARIAELLGCQEVAEQIRKAA